MKRKSLLIVVIVVLFQTFVPSFLYVEASNEETTQPKACSGPTEMMSNYFNFQHEVIGSLMESKLNERTLEVSFSNTGLFSQKVLSLSAIDLVASSFASNAVSSFSNLLTSTVLVLLVTSSVIDSNVEGFAILFEDRPVVRDYKELLDIESQIFDVAYFRSKQVNLLRPVEGNMLTGLKQIIKKYQDEGLLDMGMEPKDNISIADILLDLLSMNAAMKRFMAVGGVLGTSALKNYNGCIGSDNGNKCDENNSVLKFSQSAIEQLDKDYEEVRELSSCNSYYNFFRNSIGKAVDNGKDTVKASIQDVKTSMNRLWDALIGKNGTWNIVKGPCEGISDYEMAQLRAYWGPNWTCGEGVNLSSVVSYFREKKAQRKQRTNQKKEDEERRQDDLLGIVKSNDSTSEKMFRWYKIYGSGIKYNPEFSMKLYSDFRDEYEKTISEYGESLNNANSSNSSALLSSKGKGILDQMDTILKSNDELEKILQKIVDKQCSN